MNMPLGEARAPRRCIERTHAGYAAPGDPSPDRHARFADLPVSARRRPLVSSRVLPPSSAAPFRPPLGPQGAGARVGHARALASARALRAR
jgi:hypothetical protein